MATSFTQPPLIPQIFATSGQYSLPGTATGQNRTTYAQGWGEITSTPIANGGIPPNRLDFNGIGYLSTVITYFLQQGGFYSFSNDVNNAIGGYPSGSLLWVVDSNNNPLYMVRSLIDNNSNNFITNPGSINGVLWEKVTINANGDSMTGTLTDQTSSQIRNIQVLETENAVGVDGTIYMIIENTGN